MSSILNKRQPGTLPSNMVQNLKNDGHCLAITTQSVTYNMDPLLLAMSECKDDTIKVIDTPIMELYMMIGVKVGTSEEKGECKDAELEVRHIPRPPFFFPRD